MNQFSLTDRLFKKKKKTILNFIRVKNVLIPYCVYMYLYFLSFIGYKIKLGAALWCCKIMILANQTISNESSCLKLVCKLCNSASAAVNTGFKPVRKIFGEARLVGLHVLQGLSNLWVLQIKPLTQWKWKQYIAPVFSAMRNKLVPGRDLISGAGARH